MPASPECFHPDCQVDFPRWTKQFAKRVRKARRSMGIEPDHLAHMAGIGRDRLDQIDKGSVTPCAGEVQLLGVILGIAVDELFPLPADMDARKIHACFEHLVSQDVGLVAATGAPEAAMPPSDQDFERSVVHLHYCAECLATLPA